MLAPPPAPRKDEHEHRAEEGERLDRVLEHGERMPGEEGSERAERAAAGKGRAAVLPGAPFVQQQRRAQDTAADELRVVEGVALDRRDHDLVEQEAVECGCLGAQVGPQALHARIDVREAELACAEVVVGLAEAGPQRDPEPAAYEHERVIGTVVADQPRRDEHERDRRGHDCAHQRPTPAGVDDRRECERGRQEDEVGAEVQAGAGHHAAHRQPAPAARPADSVDRADRLQVGGDDRDREVHRPDVVVDDRRLPRDRRVQRVRACGEERGARSPEEAHRDAEDEQHTERVEERLQQLHRQVVAAVGDLPHPREQQRPADRLVDPRLPAADAGSLREVDLRRFRQAARVVA